MKTFPEQFTIGDAFSVIERGCQAEECWLYHDALNYFNEAIFMLREISSRETNVLMKSLLECKADDLVRWRQDLMGWLEAGEVDEPPERRCDRIAFAQSNTSGEKMHYTAVTTKNPANFTRDGYRLKCVSVNSNPKLLVVVTLYNEDMKDISSTLRKICNNIQYLSEASLPGYVGEDVWKNVVVCIVADGRTFVDRGTLGYLNTLGLYDDTVMSIVSQGINVQMHLFENIVYLSKKSGRSSFSPFPPLQTVFGLKENNCGKLNSHLWFFNAFAEQIQPEYTVLLDVGTKPTKSAFHRLLFNMEINPQLGGVCGEIAVDRPLPNLCNPIVASQHYEYKVSNILDKSLGSCFGYISVLPGAFSAYRYQAIRGSPLKQYFKCLTTPIEELGPFLGNMYLAEDRILAFELVARTNCKWSMHYVKDAIARTDVPQTMVALLKQRRRWMNGAFFAKLFVLYHWQRVYTLTTHGLIRRIAFSWQYMFMLAEFVLNWFLPSLFHLAIYYIVIAQLHLNRWGFVQTEDIPQSTKNYIDWGFNASYAFFFALQLCLGLLWKPQKTKYIYGFISFYFAVVVLIALVVTVLMVVSSPYFRVIMVVFSVLILGVDVVAGILHCEVHHILLSFFQYIAMLPTYINLLMSYSFCNINDISWGTKDIDTWDIPTIKKYPRINTLYSKWTGNPKGELKIGIQGEKISEHRNGSVAAFMAEQERAKREKAQSVQRRFDTFRTTILLCWIFCNVFLSAFCVLFVSAAKFLPILYCSAGSFNVFRLLGCCGHLLYIARQKILYQYSLMSGKLEPKENEFDYSSVEVN